MEPGAVITSVPPLLVSLLFPHVLERLDRSKLIVSTLSGDGAASGHMALQWADALLTLSQESVSCLYYSRMIDASPSVAIHTERYKEAVHQCKLWLSFQAPGSQIKRDMRCYPRAQRYDREVIHSGDRPVGSYSVAIREAQFFWAARRLEPMKAEAAQLLRKERESFRIARFLNTEYRPEWRAWLREHPVNSVKHLREQMAHEMALKLVDDF